VPKAPGLNLSQATALIKTVCDVAGSSDFIEEARKGLAQAGVIRAVQKHNDAVLFDWLMEAVSYQGVSDAVAAGYMEAHGTASADQIAQGLDAQPACDKLHSYWQFTGCGYKKSRGSCNRPKLIGDCPLPRLDLRRGSLGRIVVDTGLTVGCRSRQKMRLQQHQPASGHQGFCGNPYQEARGESSPIQHRPTGDKDCR